MTYTIAGHDPVTGQVGLATASYSANLLGNVAAVHRGTAGTALVAAQAFSDPRVGRRRGGGGVALRVDLDAEPVAALQRVRAATRDRGVARACRAWVMAPRPDRGRGRALLAALDALATPDVEAQAWTAALRGVLD